MQSRQDKIISDIKILLNNYDIPGVNKDLEEKNYAAACEKIGDYFTNERNFYFNNTSFWLGRSAELGNVKIISKLKKSIDLSKNVLSAEEMADARLALIQITYTQFTKTKSYSDLLLMFEQIDALKSVNLTLDQRLKYQQAFKDFAQGYIDLSRGIFTRVSTDLVKTLATHFIEKSDFFSTNLFGNILLHEEADAETAMLLRTQLERIATTKASKSASDAKRVEQTVEPRTANAALLMMYDGDCRTFMKAKLKRPSYNMFEKLREAIHVANTEQKDFDPKNYTRGIAEFLYHHVKLTQAQHQKYKQAVSLFYANRFTAAANELRELAAEMEKISSPIARVYAAHCYIFAGQSLQRSDRPTEVTFADASEVYQKAYHLLRSENVDTYPAFLHLNKMCTPELIESDKLYLNYVFQLKSCFVRETSARYAKHLSQATDSLIALAKHKFAGNFTGEWIEVINAITNSAVNSSDRGVKESVIYLLGKLTTCDIAPQLKMVVHDRLADCQETISLLQAEEIFNNRAIALEQAERLELTTESAQLNLKLRNLLINAGDFFSEDAKEAKKAEKFYRAAFKLKDARGQIGLAKTQRQLGKTDTAAEHLRAALSQQQSLEVTERTLDEAFNLAAELSPSEMDKQIGNSIHELFTSVQSDKESPMMSVLNNHLKKWLKHPTHRYPLSEETLAKVLKIVSKWYCDRDPELLKLMGHFAAEKRDFTFAIACYTRVIDSLGVSIADKRELLANIPDHCKHDAVLSNRAAELDFVAEHKEEDGLIAILERTTKEFGKEKAPQPFYDGVDAWMKRFASAEKILALPSEKRNKLLECIARETIISNNPVAEYAKQQLELEWSKKPGIICDALRFQICDIQVRLNFAVSESQRKWPKDFGIDEINQISKLLSQLHFAKRDEIERINRLFDLPSAQHKTFQSYLNSFISNFKDQNSSSHNAKIKAMTDRDTAIKANSEKKEDPKTKLLPLCKEDNLCALVFSARLLKESDPQSAIYFYIKVLVLTSLANPDPKKSQAIFDRYQMIAADILGFKQEATVFLSQQCSKHALAAWGLEFVGTPVSKKVSDAKETSSMIASILQTHPDATTDTLIMAALQSKKLLRKDVQASVEKNQTAYFADKVAKNKLATIAGEIDRLTPDLKPDVRPVVSAGSTLFTNGRRALEVKADKTAGVVLRV